MDRLTIGQITAPHGVKGEVRVFPLTDFPDRFDDLTRVILSKPMGKDEPQPLNEDVKVEWARHTGKFVILKLEGIDDRDNAERLKLLYLQVYRVDAHVLPAGSYYISDIIGLTVELPDGSVLGKVTDVFNTGSNDVYEVVRDGVKPIYIPAIKQVISDISLEKGRISIVPMPGLLD
jgi:16S rRNA processing protein RimM